MAKLPVIKRISREDVKEAPTWIEYLLYPLNQFMQGVYSALNGNLTFGDNINAEIRDLDFRTRSDYSLNNFDPVLFVHKLKTKPQGLILVQIVEKDTNSTIYGAVTPQWVDSNGTIKINYISGLQDSKNYRIKVLLI